MPYNLDKLVKNLKLILHLDKQKKKKNHTLLQKSGEKVRVSGVFPAYCHH